MSSIKLSTQTQDFRFQETDGLKIIDFGLMSLDEEKHGEHTIKVRFDLWEIVRLKQHIDAVIDKQKEAPSDWKSFAIEQLPYLKNHQDELLNPEFVNELQRSSDFLAMPIATGSDYFYIF